MIRVLKFLLISIISLVGILVAIIAFLALTDDSETVSCPAFDKELVSWFPYSKNSELLFTDERNQLSEKIIFDSLHIQHRSAYDARVKCGTCGDLVEAIFVLDKDTLSVCVERGEAMFANTPVTNLNSLYPTSVKEGPTTMLLSWTDSANPSGITQALFRRKQGLLWFERNKQKFYCVKEVSTYICNGRKPTIVEVGSCR